MIKLSKRKIMVILADRQMSVKALAEKIGMKPNNLSALLNRDACQTLTASKIASALDVPVESIKEDHTMPDYTTCTIPVGFICIPMDEYVNLKDSAFAAMTSLREELARKSTQVVERDATITKLKESLEDYRKELQAQSFLLFEARENLRKAEDDRRTMDEILGKACQQEEGTNAVPEEET